MTLTKEVILEEERNVFAAWTPIRKKGMSLKFEHQ
jgi:hypothetical protein